MVDQKLGPYWHDLQEIYGWMLKCTDQDNVTLEQLAESGKLTRIDAIMATTLIDHVEEARDKHPELS